MSQTPPNPTPSPLPSREPDASLRARTAFNGPGDPRVTQLLNSAQQGDESATNELFPIVYEELRGLAAHFMLDERTAHTLQATALVHEAYLRLVGPEVGAGEWVSWQNRAHFFGAAAKAIRRILIDHARAKARVKRGGAGIAGRAEEKAVHAVPLEEGMLVTSQGPEQLIEFDAALARLAEIDAQKAHIVELRFFAGLTVDQTAMAMGVSPSTVAREWQFARVWLFNELRDAAGGGKGR
ncbi:MAG: sigma-70 family RNA polymerase sigma factor [Phycisphaerales bacterium]|nr:sigma-70 family RNA polymerase sigma factor [Phycisphaerales bacterium]